MASAHSVRPFIVALCGLITLQGVSTLSCYVCDTTSAQSYADANDKCNIHNQQECPDRRATACMLEGYMKPNNVAQVVKRCVLKCPVFINTTAEVVRCCPKDGCNGELNHRPPPHMARERGRFPPYGGPPNMDDNMGRDMGRDMGPPDMGRDMGRDMGPPDMGRDMGPGPDMGMRPDQPHRPMPDMENPNMPPRDPASYPPDDRHPDMEANMVEPKDRQMNRPRGEGMERGPKGGGMRKKNGNASRSGMTDEQMGNSAAGRILPSIVCVLSTFIMTRWGH